MSIKAKHKIITRAEARPSKTQHSQPCGDCPFRRNSVPGWLGGSSPRDFIGLALGDGIYPCHSKIGPQCAGLAIFRANICKAPRDPKALQLKPDKNKVFSWPQEFLHHHSRGLGERE